MSTNRNEGSSILTKLQSHLEEGRRLNDEILAERDAIQAKIEQLQAYRHELDTAIQQRGIRPNDERIVHPTSNPGIVKRSRQEKIAYVQSVPVVQMKRERNAMRSIANIIRETCADGKKRSKNEIFETVLQRRSAKRGSFDSIFHSMHFSSEKDTRSSHPMARVYWLPNATDEARNETAN